jgi:tRNA-specific 2-thiouridylase
MKAIRALGLLSGGLDSALAARLLLDQGIAVTGLHLEAPTACRSDVREMANDLGIPLVIQAKGEKYLELLRAPRFGYGRNMNPCVDCRMFMFRAALPIMESVGARFLFTGEVMGQRPMSQTRERFTLIDRECGLEGRILRPLSALALPETEPERLGWVDRSRLRGIIGRNRQEQLELARTLGLKHYQSPGGGCLLTDAIFSNKLRDLFSHTEPGGAALDDVALLRVGRHFRIDDATKLVLGRDAAENAALRGFENDVRHVVEPQDFGGPTALICGALDAGALAEAARMIARYSRTAPQDGLLRWREGGVHRTLPLSILMDPPHPTVKVVDVLLEPHVT